MIKTELAPSDVITLMAALAIAAERFPDATEYEEMRMRLAKSSALTIEASDWASEARPSRPCCESPECEAGYQRCEIAWSREKEWVR